METSKNDKEANTCVYVFFSLNISRRKNGSSNNDNNNNIRSQTYSTSMTECVSVFEWMRPNETHTLVADKERAREGKMNMRFYLNPLLCFFYFFVYFGFLFSLCWKVNLLYEVKLTVENMHHLVFLVFFISILLRISAFMYARAFIWFTFLLLCQLLVVSQRNFFHASFATYTPTFLYSLFKQFFFSIFRKLFT